MASTYRLSSHDKIATRLADLLIRLNNGEKIDPQLLAEHYGVTLRTIQRDLLERLAFLPLTKDGHCFVLEPYYLGKLTTGDIHRFAALSGVKDLFPNFDDPFLRELFDSRINQAYLVKGHQYEDLSDKTDEFKQLEQAINQRRLMHFIYKGKIYTGIRSYKLVNYNGIWYLAAVDDYLLKAFCFSQLKAMQFDERCFELDGNPRHYRTGRGYLVQPGQARSCSESRCQCRPLFPVPQPVAQANHRQSVGRWQPNCLVPNRPR
jgi:hypothetical protein